ncbi:hypothetical protein NDU88_001979 [Pleurodeles waltl]|uniref:Uncharacterized protein n=1 Tax=Pleurodeles waltl TaxID=8319 RepID=A0AAV7WNK4_PLEWA|nr:hypothetical protein NDU88_001979 [Pleurodeles waltl]
MERHRQVVPSQGNTVEQYTTSAPLPQHPTWHGGLGDDPITSVTVEEPSRADLLAAIQGSRVALTGKIETLAMEVNLFRADLWKVSDKFRVAEGPIVELQMDVDTLQKQMAQVTSRSGALEARWRTPRAHSAVGTMGGSGGPNWRACFEGRMDNLPRNGGSDSNGIESRQGGTVAMVCPGLFTMLDDPTQALELGPQLVSDVS